MGGGGYKLQMLTESFDIWLNEWFCITVVAVTESLEEIFGMKKSPRSIIFRVHEFS